MEPTQRPTGKRIEQFSRLTYRQAKKLVIFIIGISVLIIGIIMIFLPGPSIIIIPAGLAILAIEFSWARYWLVKYKDTIKKAGSRINWKRKSGNNKDNYPSAPGN